MAYVFDGTGDYLTSNAAISELHGVAGLTASAWVYADGLAADMGAIHTRAVLNPKAGVEILYDTSVGANTNSITAVIDFGASEFVEYGSTNDASTGEWVHLLIWYQGNVSDGFKLYKNGVDIGTQGPFSTTSNTTSPSGTDPLLIGSRASGAAEWDGYIAEVGFWSASLTEAEISALAAGYSPKNIRQGSLETYWSGTNGLIEEVGGYTFTASGQAAQASFHPSIIRPSTYKVQTYPPLTAAAQVPPKFYHHRHHNMAA